MRLSTLFCLVGAAGCLFIGFGYACNGEVWPAISSVVFISLFLAPLIGDPERSKK